MWRDFSKVLRELWEAIRGDGGSYRPDLHYMRGPGPKWRAKHADAFATIKILQTDPSRHYQSPRLDRTEANMAQVYFHCSNSHGRLLDRRVAEVDDLFEARDHAEAIARSLIASPDLQDWRNCRLRIWDDLGEEIFEMPFWSVVGKPH